jgi:prenyltransferase beta subunit
MLRTFLLLVLISLVPGPLWADEKVDAAGEIEVNAESVVRYVLSCRKANGAFGPIDQEYTDAAWNLPAVGTLKLLGEEIEQPEKVLKHGLGFPTGHAGASHWLMFHQSLIEALLAAKAPKSDTAVRLMHQGTEMLYYGNPLGRKNELLFKVNAQEFYGETREAAELGYYNLSSLFYTLATLAARAQKPANGPELVEYILHRQTPNGGFADVRGEEAVPQDVDAHVVTTWHAVQSLKLLGAELPEADHCAIFVKQCQSSSGAFHARPGIAGHGSEDDIYYTWAALQTLLVLQQSPPLAEECGGWINSLQNSDGGFGDKPGWRSRLYSTYYAVYSLGLLDAEHKPKIVAKQRTVEPHTKIPSGEFQIYQGLNKMPVCTPADLKGLHERKLNLLALKSDKFELAEQLRAACAEQKLPMDVVLCHEAYPHRTRRGADVLLDHVANITLDPAWNEAQRAAWRKIDERGRASLPWAEYQAEVLQPVQELGSLVYPEQDFEMELAYEAYDAGVAGTSGYRAMLAGFNWAPRDFVRVFPWRERYVDKLTMVADCDAHGDLAKWSPQLDYTRYLYLAKGPGYADYLEAAAAGRVVCVIVQPEGVASGVTYYGPSAAVDYVRERISEWRWWEEKKPE